MRKWMRDRIQRRKKTVENVPAEGNPAPLQPAYFDSETPSGEPLAANPEAQENKSSRSSARSSKLEVEVPDAPGHAPLDLEATDPARHPAVADAAPDREEGRRPQRRRARGGRGRGRDARPVQAIADGGAETNRVDAGIDAASTNPLLEEPAARAASEPRPSKGTVILAIGLPGSGKSSWFKRNNIAPLSSDLLRALLFDDPAEQRFQDLVFSNLRSMLKARLIARRPLNYVDTTNLTAQERQSWIKLAQDYGYEVQAVYFDVPLDICLERNSRRPRTVPDDVMRRMAGKLRAPAFDEGFSKITVVRVKQKPKE